MKKLTLLAWLFTFVLVSAHAQDQNRHRNFDINKFHERKWEFMMSEVKLSPAEMSLVKPVFLNYEKNGWELHRQPRDLFRKTRNGTMTEKDYSELNDKMINMEIKRSQYLREYHMKLRKLLKPETLFKYYRAEKSFERQLLTKRPQGEPSRGNK